MALSKQVRDSLIAAEIKKAEVYASVYMDLAKEVAVNVSETTGYAEKARDSRTNTWSVFKQALAIAQHAGHSVNNLRLGLELACDNVGVPGGSYRSYVNTVVSLYRDIQDDNISLEDAQKLSIAAARALYRVVTPLQEARQQLNEATKNWTAEEIAKLVELAKGEAEPEVVEEVVKAAETHAAADELAARRNAA